MNRTLLQKIGKNASLQQKCLAVLIYEPRTTEAISNIIFMETGLKYSPSQIGYSLGQAYLEGDCNRLSIAAYPTKYLYYKN